MNITIVKSLDKKCSNVVYARYIWQRVMVGDESNSGASAP